MNVVAATFAIRNSLITILITRFFGVFVVCILSELSLVVFNSKS